MVHELRQAGYRIGAERTRTKAGLEAALAGQGWDVVLCNIEAAQSSDLDVLKIVRGHDPDLPVIVVTDENGAQAGGDAIERGASRCVARSDPEGLTLAVEQVLRGTATRRDSADSGATERMMEARYRQILSIAPDAIIALDEHLRITVFNQAAERLFGYAAEEAVGEAFAALLPARLVAPVLEQIQHFRVSAEVRTQLRTADKLYARRRNGLEFPAQISLSKLVEHGRTQFTAIVTDLSGREDMIAATRQSNQALDAVVQSSPVGIVALDGLQRVIVWNRSAERILGLPAKDAVGRPLPGPLAAGGAEFGAVVRRLFNGESVSELEIRQQSCAGKPLDLRISGAPLYDAEDRVRGAVCLIEDVTQSMATRHLLEHAQRMEAVGQLTGGLAHDFNNLLSIVIGNLDLLRDQPELGATARESVELALKASLGGSTLIRQLLAFARRQTLSPKAFDLGALVVSARDLLARTLGEQVEIEMRLAPDLWPALADPSQVESAIANLAINARDAMPNGGRLTLETANTHLDERYAAANPEVQPGDYVMLAVSDTGTGMPPEVLTRAFDPFFTTKEQGKGSGLGLSMIYGFARQSRGHVKIYSEVGHGTTVRLYLPRAGSGAAEPMPPAPARADSERIDAVVLVVEDNAEVRRIVCRLLRDFGCTVIEAGGAAAALEILRSDRKVDLMFSDVVMPGGMSGTELVQAARRLRPGIKILLTTGFAEPSLRNRAQLADAEEIITKPYRRQDLARKIRKVLGLES